MASVSNRAALHPQGPRSSSSSSSHRVRKLQPGAHGRRSRKSMAGGRTGNPGRKIPAHLQSQRFPALAGMMMTGIGPHGGEHRGTDCRGTMSRTTAPAVSRHGTNINAKKSVVLKSMRTSNITPSGVMMKRPGEDASPERS